MKQKDFFSQLVRQGKITDVEATKFIDTLPDVEVPDTFVKAHEDSFMTLDRAASHKDIHKKIKREVLDPIDNDLLEFYETIKEYAEPGLENIMKTEANTYNKVAAIKKVLPEVLKKAKGTPQTDEETKKKLTEYEKKIQEFGDKFSDADKDYKKKVAEAEKSFDVKLNEYKLGSELEKLTNKYKLAEAFDENRQTITEVTLAKVKGSNHLKLGEKDGRPAIIVTDDAGMPKYIGNNPVTIDSLLDEAYKPFLKKSESGERQENQKTSTSVETQNKTSIRGGAPTTVKVR